MVRTLVGGEAVLLGLGGQGRGQGANVLLTLFQPVPYSPLQCPFQVGAPAPPSPTLS